MTGRRVQKEDIIAGFYRLFWIYIICGTVGFVIESVWCWYDFQEFTSRTSNLFFPISCVWGLGGVILSILTMKNRWQHWGYIFLKCVLIGAAFEFLCGCLGERILAVTFWDYSGMPLHIGKYINIPFCLVWGLIGVLWVWKGYPLLKQKLKPPIKTGSKTAVQLFMAFMVSTQLLTGAALLRMNERQNQIEADTVAEQVLDLCFTDQRLQSVFPKMKSTATGEKIYTDQ